MQSEVWLFFFLYPYNFSVAGTDPQEKKGKENERLRRSLERFEAYIAETKTYCRLLSLSSFRRLYLVFHHRRRGFSHSCFPPITAILWAVLLMSRRGEKNYKNVHHPQLGSKRNI